MNKILKIGMDVHSTNYTLCIVEPKLEGDPELLYEVQVEPDYHNILKVISDLKKKYKEDTLHITCGYEAGCLGYTLYHDLDKADIKCIILAPSTMEMPGGKRIKTDKRDAWLIAKCLAPHRMRISGITSGCVMTTKNCKKKSSRGSTHFA